MDSGTDVQMRLDQTDPSLLGTTQLTSGQSYVPAAQYVRMSTDLQCYSIQNQMHAIAAYARSHGMVIIHTFSDEGRSGLRLDQRPGLRALLSLVQGGSADFKVILVYDVSRWGRFQDTDESGYWEFICKLAGVRIHYCAEPFVNDDSVLSALIKNLKRTMAAEYSRELSTKVFAGQCRLVALGYHQGGTCGYGLRRMLVDQEGRPKGLLPLGARKSLKSDRIVLVPGPEKEQAIIREIYRSFTEEAKSQTEIKNDLNARRIDSGINRPWSHYRIHGILTDPRYIGAAVFNRRSRKLKQSAVRNPESMWIRRDGAFTPIVTAELFDKAKKLFETPRHPDPKMLDQLRSLLSQQGMLSGQLIDRTPGMLTQKSYCNRFGGLKRAYEKVGYTKRSFGRRETEAARHRCLNEFLSKLEAVGATAAVDIRTGVIHVNEDLVVWLAVSRCLCNGPEERWWIPRRTSPTIDLTMIGRLDASNDAVWDFYVFPKEDFPKESFLTRHNSPLLDPYHFDNLDRVCDVFRRERVGGDHHAQGTE